MSALGQAARRNAPADVALAVAVVVCGLSPRAAGGETSARELLQEALAGEFTRLDEMLDAQEELLPLVDARLEGDASVEERRKMTDLLLRIGQYDAAHVFRPERVKSTTELLAEETDQIVIRWIAFYLREAADGGRLKEPEEIIGRAAEAFVRTRDLQLGYLLLRLAPHDAAIRALVEQACRHERLSKRKQRALLAAAGDESAIWSLVSELELDSRSTDRGLNLRRVRAINDLGDARDSRAVGALMELLEKEPPIPPSEGDMMSSPLHENVVPALRNILAAYPDVLPTERRPETKEGFLDWWRPPGRGGDAGGKLTGLDIRESVEELRRKRYVVRPRKPRPRHWANRRRPREPQPTAYEIARRRVEEARRSWNARADALAVKDGKRNALEFYRQAAEATGPFTGDISRAFVKLRRSESTAAKDAGLDELVDRGRAALVLIRRGLECERCEMPHLADMRESMPFLPRMVALGRLLLLEGRSHEQQGRLREACGCYLDAVRFAGHLACQRLGVGASTSLATERAACRSILRVLRSRSMASDDYAWLCAELTALGESSVSVLATVREECDVLRRSCERMAITDIVSEVEKAGSGGRAGTHGLRKEDLLADLARHEKALRSWLELPYGEARMKPEPRPESRVGREWLPRAGDLRMRRLFAVCDRRATLLAAAVMGHRSRTGSFPRRLDALVPEYLAELPRDVFTDGPDEPYGPFRYLVTKDRCVIYSRGPDADDDKAERRVAQPGRWAGPADGDVVYELERGAQTSR